MLPAAFKHIRRLFEEDNLVISAKKIGFAVLNSVAKRLLEEQLPEHGPKIHDGMRSWGKGPVAALQHYLRDNGWQTDTFEEWTKPIHNGDPAFKINMQESWHNIKIEFKRAEQSNRIHCINARTILQEIQRPLDWQLWSKLTRILNQQNSFALQTWHKDRSSPSSVMDKKDNT